MISHINHHVFITPIGSHWRELSNGILVDVWVHFFSPNHPFLHQDPGIAASNSVWPSPPNNWHHPQFGSTIAKTIPLVHSWCGPSLGMVSTFSLSRSCAIVINLTVSWRHAVQEPHSARRPNLMTISNGSTNIVHQTTIFWKQPCLW